MTKENAHSPKPEHLPFMEAADQPVQNFGVYLENNETAAIVNNSPFLARLESGTAPQKLWDLWGTQRYHASHGFLPFLEGALEKTQRAGLHRTAEEIRHNICDERGVSKKDGTTPLKSGAHEDWRIDFYDALGITQDRLQQTRHTTLAGTRAQKVFEMVSLQGPDNVWQHVGALFAVEVYVPVELKRIQTGLRNTPHLQERFDPSTPEGRKNSLYVDHHVVHDAEDHAPRLYEAIVRDCIEHGTTDNELALFSYGFDSMAECRYMFLSHLEQEAQKIDYGMDSSIEPNEFTPLFTKLRHDMFGF